MVAVKQNAAKWQDAGSNDTGAARAPAYGMVVKPDLAENAFQEILHLVHVGLAGYQRVRSVGRPFDHRAVIELHVVAAQDLGQHEPVRRRPVAGVAVADDGQLSIDVAIDGLEIGAALEPVRRDVIGVFLKQKLGARDAAADSRLRMLGIAKELLKCWLPFEVAP